MKKTIIILTSILFFFQASISFAEGTAAGACEVESGPSKGLVEYFQDVQSILSAVQNEVGKAKGCGENGTGALDNVMGNAQKGYSTIVGETNKVIDFNGFLSSWEFNLYPIFNGNVPQEFYRDHDYLNNRIESINRISLVAAKKCALYIPFNANDTIKAKITKYGIDPSTISSTLNGLRKLNIEATAFFRCTVVGSMGGCNLSNKTLKDVIQSSYGDTARDICNKNSSFDKMMEQLSSITKYPYGFSGLKKGMNEWSKAITLLGQTLGGTNDKEYQELEKKLLTKELQKQGISGTQADAILNNLDCMNDQSNTIAKCINKAIGRMIEPFKDAYKKISDDITKKSPDTKSIPRQTESLKSLDYITKDIKNDYENIKTLMSGENKSQEKGLATLIQLHQNLNKTNETLKNYIKTAQELCDIQKPGHGVCQ
ncbi:MAG: hypothetical protein PHZ26_00545 [Candidatus Gracilibacteria bacterium]|nr:hypothetical protein [Candidatus Gracilibacteria bacterium]MDD2908226.1 hypothetical protein [Candidatus Gracilibacteria bacterium]